MITKYCKKCSTNKSTEEFYKNHRTRDGLFYQCKNCCSIQDKKQTSASPFKKQIREFNRQLVKEGVREKFTIEQFSNLLETQNNKCNICAVEMIQPCIDHDHSSGKVRSLLCRKCNILLGMCNDNISILENAIKYLNFYSLEDKINSPKQLNSINT